MTPPPDRSDRKAIGSLDARGTGGEVKSLVIGYGSIGERHARILKELGCKVSIVSSHEAAFKPCFATVEEALRAEQPECAVIANETVKHFETLVKLRQAGFQGNVLVEKPVFYSSPETPVAGTENVFIAYNLRLHPLLSRLKSVLEGEKIISVQAYVGRYLPRWRPARDYRKSYSAKQTAGGGVLRDLSHEIDYLLWILGRWERVTAIGGHFSHLDINSDDTFGLMFKTKRSPLVTLQMNYLDRVGRREIIVNTDKYTFFGDLISGDLKIDDAVESFAVERDFTYKAEHQALLKKKFETLCSFEEGMEVLSFVEAAEIAST